MRNLYFILLWCIPGIALPQNKEVDSLRQALNDHSQRDTIRIGTLLKIGECLAATSSESKDYIEEALAIAAELRYEKGMARAYYTRAHFYWYRYDFSKAIEDALSMMRIYERTNNSLGLFEANLTLAGINMTWKDFERADYYMDKALQLVEQNKDHVDVPGLYHKIAFLKLQEGKMEEGIAYANKSLLLYQELKDVNGQADCYFLLARAEWASANLNGSLAHYQKAMSLSKISDQPSAAVSIFSAHEGIGEILIELKQYDKALLHLDTALRMSQQAQSINMVKNVYVDLTRLNEARGNYQEALKYERLHRNISDSVFSTEKSQQFAEIQTKYETEKKDQEIALLEQKNKTQTLLKNSLIAGLLLTMTSALIIYRLQRARVQNARQLIETKELLVKEMEQTDKLKSRFFANISHEFRTPLTLILSPVEEKLLVEDLSQKDKISFQSIRRSANRLLQLVNQVLELSKLESGFMKLDAQPGGLHHFMVPILSLFDSMADVNQVLYVKNIQLSETNVLFDPDKLEKIVSNLLSNAFKFSPKGSTVHVSVITTEKTESVTLTLEIRNQYFIPPDTLNKIFEPFYQGEQSPHGMPGTGLGLPLVKELVKLHGGTIQVTSHESEGTLFIVNFTLEKTGETVITQHNTAKGEPADVSLEEPFEYDAPAVDKARETILIVEDNSEVRALVRQGLQPDYNVVEASTGVEGLALAQSQNIDLIVSDVMMPEMNGVELCHTLKTNELTSHIPVVLLTARGDHESKLEGLRIGADDYVIKPFNMQELLARIANLIGLRKKLIQKYKHATVIQPHEITVTPLDERFIQKALAIVEENIDNTNFNIDKFSDAMGMSRMNLHRKLKSITGLATNEFIQDFRLKRAALLIEKKADTLAQIAYMVGFNDQSYFTKSFKKKFGRTPTEYGTDVSNESKKSLLSD